MISLQVSFAFFLCIIREVFHRFLLYVRTLGGHAILLLMLFSLYCCVVISIICTEVNMYCKNLIWMRKKVEGFEG